VTCWLLKTEPSEYSFEQLSKAGEAVWDGVANPVALRNLAAARPGDRVFVYHTGAQKAVVGDGRVTRAAFPDPGDPSGKAIVIGVRAGRALASPVPLARLKAHADFAQSPLVRQGRLSVVPITARQEAAIDALAARP
jgi:predicted RNA-binding protein with PUA-like domain